MFIISKMTKYDSKIVLCKTCTFFKRFYNNESSQTDTNFEKLFTNYLNKIRLNRDKSSPHVL